VKLALGSFLVLIAVLVFVRIAAVETETRPENWLLGPENWPATVEDTVRDLLPRISWFEKLRIMFMKKEATISLHFGLGTGYAIGTAFGEAMKN
jgi:hypothetical protein